MFRLMLQTLEDHGTDPVFPMAQTTGILNTFLIDSWYAVIFTLSCPPSDFPYLKLWSESGDRVGRAPGRIKTTKEF